MKNITTLLHTIRRRLAIEEFNLTGYAGFDNMVAVGRYDKATDTVRIYCWGLDSANLPTGSALFTVPEQYRPSANVALIMMFTATGGAGTHYAILQAASGAITQNAGNTLRSVLIVGEYKLGGGSQ